jgi:ATP-dependent DNA ligase
LGQDGDRVRLYSRPGNDFTGRFPLIVEAMGRLRSRSCIVDGEAVACGSWAGRAGRNRQGTTWDGVPIFDCIG